MSVKTVLRLVVILAVLVGISLLIPKIAHRKTSRQIFSSIKTDNLVRIEISNNETTVNLQKKDSQWQVMNTSYTYTADQVAVENILTAVPKIEVKDIISSNPERHGRFDVSEATGTRIRLFSKDSDQAQADFYLGKSAPNYTDHYFRMHGEDDVYYSSGLSAYQVDKRFENWRNRKLGARERDAIDTIKYTEGAVIHEIVRNKEAWTYMGKPVPVQDLNALLQQISTLSASEVIPSEDENNIKQYLSSKKPAVEFIINEAGNEIQLTLYPVERGKKDEKPEIYRVLKKNEPGVFNLYNATLDNIRNEFKKVKDASEKPPVAADTISEESVNTSTQ